MGELQVSLPRDAHPRPDFMRDTCVLLDGRWQFAFDDANRGLAERWFDPGHAFGMEIEVPFSYQAEKSGIGGDEIHPVIWYRRSFAVPEAMGGQSILLRFGAVDWACRVYVNGVCVGGHTSGYTPFALDITSALKAGDNDLCVRVEDTTDCAQPRGKQYWRRGVMGCWYTPNSGIWQSVYLEAAGENHLVRLHVRPDGDAARAHVTMALDHEPAEPLTIELTVSFEAYFSRTYTFGTTGRETRFTMDMRADDTVIQTPDGAPLDGQIQGILWWGPDHPHLYDVSARVKDGERTVDHVTTYFGMRKIELRDGTIWLNERPLYQRLVLDQGYWPDTLLTPPNGDALREDVLWTQKLGFNGARKHQKIEDPRYYYWADRLGLLVWGEVPSAYRFSHDSIRALSDTLMAFIDRDYNHPSIIVWVPLNESWGVNRILTDKNQQALGRTLYHLCKAADGTRLVSANDGWEQTTTDICALHDYTASGDDLRIHFASREQVDAIGCDQRRAWADGEWPTGGEAFLVTEYGGIAFDSIGEQGKVGGMPTWGYNGKVEGEDAFLARFDSATGAVRAIPFCQGYCYTQLTDVMQEINGLLTPDRRPKVAPERIAALNGNPKGR